MQRIALALGIKKKFINIERASKGRNEEEPCPVVVIHNWHT